MREPLPEAIVNTATFKDIMGPWFNADLCEWLWENGFFTAPPLVKVTMEMILADYLRIV